MKEKQIDDLREAAVYKIAYDLMEYDSPDKLRDTLTDEWPSKESDYNSGFWHGYHHLLDVAILIEKFFTTLSNEQADAIIDLCSAGFVFPRYGDNKSIEFSLLCSDTFGCGSDAEDFEASDAVLLNRLNEKFGNWGPLAWIAQKRNIKIMKYVQAPVEYSDAVKWLSDPVNVSEAEDIEAEHAVDWIDVLEMPDRFKGVRQLLLKSPRGVSVGIYYGPHWIKRWNVTHYYAYPDPPK